MITTEFIISVVSYDRETGVFTWKERSPSMFNSYRPNNAASVWNSKYAGKEIKKQNDKGYIFVDFLWNHFPAHRLAWFIVYGRLPKGDIDHINGNPSDNRIANLREATRQQNCFNRGARVDNKCGLKGVHWKAPSNSWVAQIQVGGKRVHLGCFRTKEAAHSAYVDASIKHYKEFSPYMTRRNEDVT